MKYHSLGGVENLSINWQLPYIGPLDDIPWDYFPDVVISHHFGQEANYLTLDGNLLAVSIGGQEMLLDDVCTGPLTDVEGPVVSEGPTVVLFPNPVTSGAPLLIKVEEPSFSDISFELFDAQGRRVGAMISVEGKLAEIPTEGLPMGLYFFRMSNDGITLHAGKLVIQ